MFGITLATGLVVDDAIVVIENVQRHISAEHTDPHTATSVAMSEVTSAVVATSLVLISVFVPVSFFPGTTGILYRQFALTIAFAIAISAFNALTLSPALAALFLRGEGVKHGLFGLIDRTIQKGTQIYGRADASCVALPLRGAAGVHRGTGVHGLSVHARADGVCAVGRPELPDLHRAGAGGRFAQLHQPGCGAGRSKSSTRTKMSTAHSP